MSSLVRPEPPSVRGRLPFVGAGLDFLRNPTTFLEAARAQHGETFFLQAFGFRLLFVFSPDGVRSLYKLPEQQASFVEATRTLIGFKLPPELLQSDMTMFHHLFGRGQMEGYLSHMRDAVREDLVRMGATGEIEIFTHMKRLMHRVAFRCWAGREAASPRHLDELIHLFEQLDPEEAFVRPARTFVTVLTRKAFERRALRKVQEILTHIWEARERRGEREGDVLESLHELYGAKPLSDRYRLVARDVMILHLASQSNLYAAMSWTLVNLLRYPEYLERVRAGDTALLDQCAQESIRLAQRSITLRKVVARCAIEDGATRYEVEPGVFIATMLSVNNSAFADLARFDPSHYEKNKIAAHVGLPTPEVVSTFGHWIHSCPGQRFALSAIRITITELLGALEMTPRFGSPSPKASQMGAVARSETPCIITYRRRGDTLPPSKSSG